MPDPPEAVTIRHMPESRAALEQAIRDFVREEVDLIVIDGGDGTIREVMTVANRIYKGEMPRMAVMRSGKTNALAMDLGVPDHWSLADIVAAYRADSIDWRSPIHVRWGNDRHPDQLGFIFGFGAYLRGTHLAQRVHQGGWFNSIAVFITLIWAMLQTSVGRVRNSWTRGDVIRISHDGDDIALQSVYLLLASTLRRMPLGLRPFGESRDGLKLLSIQAPPRHILRSLPKLLWGKRSERLAKDGYVRRDIAHLILKTAKGFILDGERFPAGTLTISHGKPIAFIVPPKA